MKYTEQTNNVQSRFKMTIELSESDMIGLKMTDDLKKFIQKKLSEKGVASKLFALLALVEKIEERQTINLN